MRHKEHIVLLLIVGLGIITANFVGFKVAFLVSLPGTLILLGIAFIAFRLTSSLSYFTCGKLCY